jgi:hypothetical protein
MGTILGSAVSVLERRFLVNAFLPAIIFFGGYITFFFWATGRLPSVLHAFAEARLAPQLVLVITFFGLAWFCAAFIASQWRNLIRLYEGYFFFMRPLRELAKLGKDAHIALRQDLMDRNLEWYGRYSADADQAMPTQLGNVLRAAEYYPGERYGADFILLWTRLGHLCPKSFLDNMDQFQAALDFLVVAVTGFSLLAVSTALTAAVTGHGAALFLVCLVGGFALAHLAYTSAVAAATELGETMRASFDLYRNELLIRLRWPLPADSKEEREIWQEVTDFIDGVPRHRPYSRAYVEIDPTHLL